MDSQPLLILLRLVHILAGVFWVGAVMLLTLFVLPAQRALNDRGRFMRELMVVSKLSTWMSAAAGSSVLAGLVLYGRNVSVSDGAWAATRPAMVLGVGAVASIVAMIVGASMSARSQRRMAVLGGEIAATGAPSAAQQAEMQALQRRATLGAKITLALLLVATATMAVGRYV